MATDTTYYAWCPEWNPIGSPANYYWAVPLCRFRHTETQYLFPQGHWNRNDPETKTNLIQQFRCVVHDCPPELFRRSDAPIRTRQNELRTKYVYDDQHGWQKRRPPPNTLHTGWTKKP